MTFTASCSQCGSVRTLTRRPVNPEQRCNACANRRHGEDWRCSEQGCDRTELRRGDLCGFHYMRAYRAARPRPQEDEATRERRALKRAWRRYWAKVDQTGDCWVWTGALSKSGYGRVGWGGRYRPVHRIAFEAVHGPVPDGLEIDHLCRTRNCVRVDHLEAVTHQENMRRATALITHCPQGHPYSGDNLIFSPATGRMCRACRPRHQATSRARKRQAGNGENVGSGEAHPERRDAEAAALRHHPRVEES